jgi:hypothetical protein
VENVRSQIAESAIVAGMNKLPPWCRDVTLLSSDAPIPVDRPFTPAEAQRHGVNRHLLSRLVGLGLLRRPLRGVLVATQEPDTLALRVAALKLVVPAHCVVTDRTAAWAEGVDILPRTARYEMPFLDAFSTDGSRMRRDGVRSGVRELHDSDVIELDGLRLTSPLRTACDLGRSLWRFDALAALDGFLRVGVDPAELVAEIQRFRGFRGVLQLRTLAPLADGRSESVGESALRLHWYDSGLPRPELQIWVHDDAGVAIFRLDIGLEEIWFAVEYDGEDFHGEDDEEHDRERRGWMERERAWVIEAFRKEDVYALGCDPRPRLVGGYRRARARVGSRDVTYIDLARPTSL